MSWNHRVVRTVHQSARGERVTYAIHEVHYPHQGDDTPVAMTENPVAPVAESLDGLRWTLTRMLEALDKPVLTEADFPSSKEEEAVKR